MQMLPQHLEPYRTVGPFDQDSLPSGFLSEHRTKAGVWGLLEVERGEIRYVITQPGEESSQLLSNSRPGVIAPQQRHHLELTGEVTFRVTFLREPAS